MQSISTISNDPKTVIGIIADNMIKTRPMKDVVLRPYRKSEIYMDTPVIGPRHIDIKKLYPEAKKGDTVYISTILDSCDDSDAKINFIGNAKVFLDNKEIYDAGGIDGKHSCEVHLPKGETYIIFKVTATNDDEFTFDFMPSVRYYWMWAKYYLLNVRAKSPLEAFRDEDGVAISRIYHNDEDFDWKYVHPIAPELGNIIDFEKIFPDTVGFYGYALTYAQENTTLDLYFDCPHKVFVNGQTQDCDILKLKKGDMVLVKAEKSKGDWKFSYSSNGIGIPMLKSNRKSGDKWLTLGTFGTEQAIDTPYSVESDINFTNPYKSADGDIFWKIADKDDYVRPYLATRFFGQWFYALMIGTHGLLRASEALDCEKYREYFIKSTEILAKYFDYMQYEKKEFGQTSFLEISVELDNLDAIGSIGRNLAELYSIAPNENVRRLIDILAKSAMENIPRFSDGTYHRETDMWADDLFMSCPFLVRVGKITGDERFFDEVQKQLLGFKKRLWMPDEKTFSHIFFLDTNEPNNIPWGRGNGWVYVTLSDVLEQMPQNAPMRNELMELYLEFTEGLLKFQDKEGLWHQVLNRPDSYAETSCTGMFMLGLCRGIKNGWLNRSYFDYVIKAYNGLIDNKIGADGNIYDVCMGSSNSKNVEYYLNLGTIDNDDHGTGVILSAMSEMIKIGNI